MAFGGVWILLMVAAAGPPTVSNTFDDGAAAWTVEGAEVFGRGQVRWGGDNVAVVKSERGKCLRVERNGSVATPYIRYRGEKLEVSAMVRLDGVRAGKNHWNKAAIQVLVFDEQRRPLKVHWGHWNVMLEKGTQPWLAYERRLVLPDEVKWVRVWVGMWNAGAGVAYFDDVRVRLLPRHWGPGPIELSVDTAAAGETLRQFWDGVDASHAERVRHAAYQKGLDMLPRLGLRWVRVHTPLACIRYDDAGRPEDYSVLDEVLGSIVSRGLKVYFSVEPMPDPLASKPRRGWCNVSPPRDYSAWRRLCRQVVEHLENVFGPQQVRSWVFGVWNEPFARGYFDGTDEEYIRLYDYTVAGLLDADARLTVGGLDGAAPDALTEKFLRHVTSGRSEAGPGAPFRCDFLSLHYYAGTGYAEPFPMLRRSLMGLQWAAEKMRAAGFAGPLLVTEWGCSSSARAWTDGAYNAVFMCRAVGRLADMNLPDSLYYFGLVDHIYRKEKMYAGGLAMLTPAGAPKPIVAAFEALNEMRGKRLKVVGGDKFTGALAVRRDDGSVAVLVWNHWDDPHEPMPPRRCRLRLLGVGAARYDLFVIDAVHSNAIDDWRAAGSPQEPSAELLRRLDRAGRLEQVASGTLRNGTVELTMAMPSAALVVVRP